MASNENENSDDQTMDTINFPSAKLGVITRKRNEIDKLCQDNSNVDQIKEMIDVYKSKIEKFEEACEQESSKDVPVEELDAFNKWYKKQRKAYSLFLKKVEIWILENSDDDTTDSDGETEKSEHSESETESSNNNSHSTAQLLEALLKNQTISKLPNNEPPTFNGADIAEYRPFILAFERLIEKSCTSDEDKYYYLLRYTTEQANDLVNSCYSENTTDAFKQAKKLLETTYGNQYKLAQRYLDQLLNWEPIKSEDSKELAKFSAYLTTCLNLMSKMSALNQLNSWRDIKEIIMKLPFDLRKQFRSLAQKELQKNNEIKFEHLVKFVNAQANLLNMPLLGEITEKRNATKEKKVEKSKQKSFYTTLSQTDSNKPCPCCKKTNHALDYCKFFLQKTVKEREEFVGKRKLCYGCLGEGHQNKNCKNRLTCKKCKKSHPSSLHRESKPLEVQTVAGIGDTQDNELVDHDVNMTTKHNFKTACPAIPVIVKNKLNNECTTTYIALDNYSTSCYMDQNLMKQLKMNGIEQPLSVTTIEGQMTMMKISVVSDLEIMSLDNNYSVSVPKIYAKDNWPFTIDDSPKREDIMKFPSLKEVPFHFIDKPIGILIGMNMPEIIKPLKIIATTKKGPYASCHQLGWALNGPIHGSSSSLTCLRTKVCDYEQLDTMFNAAFAKDFETKNEQRTFSVDEQNWLRSVEENTVKLSDNHWQISLPFKQHPTTICNYNQVLHRFRSLTMKLKKDNELLNEYCKFMNTMNERNFMEKVPDDEIELHKGATFYLSHHCVFHKQKKKLRVVFDCSMKTAGVSLNDLLWKGPDLTNNLVGVLLRFRLNQIAVSADIEKMYHMIKLPKADRDFLRFLWFENNDISKKPTIYRMTVHIFGSTSSPAIANFALKKSVEYEQSEQVKAAVMDAFYVDDMLHSFSNDQNAIEVVSKVQHTLAESGFNLTSFSSNSRKVLKHLPVEKLSHSMTDVDISGDNLSQERALGIVWKTNNDTLGYCVNLPDHPATKRGILSTICSIYDPLFLASPALIKAKRLFQICCHLKLDWDALLPEQYKGMWNRWKEEIILLNNYEIRRCYTSLESPEKTQIHIFADGSEIGYGAVAYLRQSDVNESISVSLIMAKARLTPLNRSSLKTVPRIELNAAKLAVDLYERLKVELQNYLHIDKVFFWTDSIAVKQYIASDNGHFQTFVANRVAYIRSLTDVKEWQFVPGELNPADLLSRGSSNIKDFIENVTWCKGPAFLSEPPNNWLSQEVNTTVSTNDIELKKKPFSYLAKAECAEDNAVMKLMFSTNDLHKLKCRVATFLRLKNFLQNKVAMNGKLNTAELLNAELVILRYSQQNNFGDVYQAIKSKDSIPKRKGLKKLNLFIDTNDLIRVGGRLRKAPLPYATRHPILLDGKSKIAQSIVQECHLKLGHMGREFMLAELQKKYHIIACTKLLKSTVKLCVICRKVQGKVSSQLMADLPQERLLGDYPPFTHTATDLFGPFIVSSSRGNKQDKRYGVIFSCMTSRAIHLEMTPSLDTGSFINALRRFISRRGSPKTMLSDNGTNLTSADKELRAAINEWNKDHIQNYCLQKGMDWKFQPPQASHFGGVFEREIRTVRKIFNSLLWELSNQIKITDDFLHTFFCEAENIINNRPLTATSTDHSEIKVLTPNDILRLSVTNEFPPGVFVKKDLYLKRKWRQAQYCADLFCKRFQNEYLPLLQARAKWTTKQRSHKVGDIVLVVDQSVPRNHWCTGIVTATKISDDGLVRSCEVTMLKNKYTKCGFEKITLRRPVSKLILLCPVEKEI